MLHDASVHMSNWPISDPTSKYWFDERDLQLIKNQMKTQFEDVEVPIGWIDQLLKYVEANVGTDHAAGIRILEGVWASPPINEEVVTIYRTEHNRNGTITIFRRDGRVGIAVKDMQLSLTNEQAHHLARSLILATEDDH